MSFYGQKDGLFWPSYFFPDLRDQPKEISRKISEIKQFAGEYRGDFFKGLMLSRSNHEPPHWYDPDNHAPRLACERVALKFMLVDSNFAADFLSEEELDKAQDTYARKQHNNHILQKLLAYFAYAFQSGSYRLSTDQDPLLNLFAIPILDEYKKCLAEEVDKRFKPLKKEIDHIASGVHGSCYFHCEAARNHYDPLPEDLTIYVSEHYGDAYRRSLSPSEALHSYLLPSEKQREITRRVLQRALLEDADFWSKCNDFDVILFLRQVEEHNGSRHARKILDRIVANLEKDPDAQLVLEHGLPICMADFQAHLYALEERTRRFTFSRLSHIDPDCIDIYLEGFCYPALVPSCVEPKLQAGKALWEAFIGEFAYPHDKEKAFRCLREEVERFAQTETFTKKKPREIAILLDRDAFLYEANCPDRTLFSAHHPDFFSAENIWNRVYLKAYILTCMVKEEQDRYVCLHKIYLDVIKLLESRFGLKTAHQVDDEARAHKYLALKEKLASLDVEISDSRREEYIIALLDWDTALREEYDTFPILEQLGDALYGLAVAEMLFYQPNSEGPGLVSMANRFEDMTRAEAQITLSRFHGFDKLYHSVGASGKYGEHDSGYGSNDAFVINDTANKWELREKYLADSLEMILGAVCRDRGFETALRLAKRLLTEAYPQEFPPEIRHGEDTRHMEQIGEDYWTRILPAPLTPMIPAQMTLWRALEKAFLTVVLGTDTDDKRVYITYTYGNTLGASHHVNWPFYDYLHGGWNALLQGYSEQAKLSFEADSAQRSARKTK